MNGYPDHVIEKTIARKLKDFTLPTSLSLSALVGNFFGWT